MGKASTIAVDLAKNVFELAVVDDGERVLYRRRFSRARFREFLSRHEPVEVVMEACGSGHYWARTALEMGHRPVLLPPKYVKPFVLRNKTDRTDVSGLLAARRHPEMTEVAVKTVHQQTLTSIHRLRSSWMTARTRRISTVRGILRELGIVIPQGAQHVVPRLCALEAGSEVPPALLVLIAEVRREIEGLEARIKQAERQLRAIAGADDTVKRLMTIPGIGLLTATGIVAFVGDLSRFKSGRHLSSFLGLTPREYSSGGSRRLGRISKRGNSYLRMSLIHGARSSLLAGKRAKAPDRLRRWALAIEKRGHHNQAAVALANKMARIAWAVATRQTVYVAEMLSS